MTVLVAYASKHGSTREIAEAIGGRLRVHGLDAEVHPVGEVLDLEPYAAVVLGSAVYLGKWMKEALDFLDRNEEVLRRMPVWLFSSGPTGAEAPDEALLEKNRRRLDSVGARDHHVFRGALEPGELGFLERRVIKTAKAPVGDFREWTDVEHWADQIADSSALVGA
jgi:menaquinone-dependent protoporphyrinogen oxidase